MSNKSNSIIVLRKSSSDHPHWWEIVWKTNDFHRWDDADDWLDKNYKANATSIRGGFRIEFKDQETCMFFKMKWVE